MRKKIATLILAMTMAFSSVHSVAAGQENNSTSTVIFDLYNTKLEANINKNKKDVYEITPPSNESEENECENENAEIEEYIPPDTVAIDIPTDTKTKTYEDGGLITDSSSPEYQEMSKCYINYQGHYIYEDESGEIYYAVAMGNYFDEVGSKYKVTLDNGNTFNIIKCDTKQDRHTTNQMIDSSGAMIEFIIDTDTAGDYYGIADNGYVLGGSFNNTEQFKGYITQIEQYTEVY